MRNLQQNPNFKVTSVYFSHYEKTSHGLKMQINGQTTLNKIDMWPQMNVYGKFWKALPLGLDKIIKWTYLPLSLRPTYWKSATVNEGFFTIEIHFGTKEGQFGISKARLSSELENLSKKNDQVMEIEILDGASKPLFSVFTKPSLIVHSLGRNEDALWKGEIPPDIRKDTFFEECYGYCRWLLLPSLFLMFLILVCNNPRPFFNLAPVIFFNPKLNKGVQQILPPAPETMSQSWNISRLEHEFEMHEKGTIVKNATRMNEILVEIGKVLSRNNITKEEIHKMYEEIVKKESEIGLAQKIKGFFNFVNIIWLLAIIGLTVSVGPCIFYALYFIRDWIVIIARFIWNHIILPLHSWGIWELCAQIFSAFFIIDGFRFAAESGFFVGITGLFLSFAANVYTFFLRAKVKPEKNVILAYSLGFSAQIVPMAIAYQSTFLGWIAVLLLYNAIGFSFIACGLCYFVGFEDDEAMMRVSFTSSIVGGIFILLKVFGISVLFIKPFTSALTIFSAVTLLLALLIFSSYWYRPQRRNYPHYNYIEGEIYSFRQLPMIVTLIAFLFFGNVQGLVGMTNTALVYLVLQIIEKYCDAHYALKWNVWIMIFVISFCLYRGALYVHQHPEMLLTMFNYE